MRVLFLTNIPSPYRVDFFNHLGKLCDLVVLYERKAAKDRDSKWISNQAKNFKEVYLAGSKITTDGALCLEVVKWLDKDRFDVFIVGGYSTPTGMLATWLLKMKKIPFVLNSDGGLIKEDNKLKYKIKKYFISSAAWWLSTGEVTNKYLEYYGADRKSIFTYPLTSIEDKDIIKQRLSKIEKQNIRRELNIAGETIALSVGQFIHRKGYDLLIEAWRNVSADVHLMIIGSGPEEEKLKALIHSYNLKNINIIGFKDKQELKKYYLAADLFILPTREDIWGLVVNEAMAYGLPIITTNKCVAGVELVKNDENGVIIESDNVEMLSKQINRVLGDKLLIESMGNKSLQIIKKFTIENMANEHMKVLNKILGEKR